MTSEGREATGSALSKAMDEAVSRGAVRVPPYPSTAMKLQGVLAKDEYRTADLVEAMRTDQVFTGNLLRLANSPMYRRAAEATSIAAAVTRVGARELTRLAMAAAITQASQGGTLGALRRRVWRESLAGAVVAEALASDDGVEPGEAFVAALLHDVGKLLALTTLEELFARSPTLRVDDEACWAELERTHVSLGALLAQRWQLPGVLGAVISLHHEEREREAPLTKLVLRADRVVRLLETRPEVTVTDLRELGLSEKAASELAELLPELPSFLNALDVEAPPPVKRLDPSPRKTWLCAELVNARGTPWPVRQLEARTVELTTHVALQPGLLIELVLTPGDFRFWAVIEHCASKPEAFEVRLRPFALDADKAVQWQELVAGHARAAA